LIESLAEEVTGKEAFSVAFLPFLTFGGGKVDLEAESAYA
jgi:hypothetical protein